MISIKNYYHPTPKKMRVLGDFFLVLIPVITGFVPSMPISEDNRFWVTFATTIGGVSAKFITNLFRETNEPETEPDKTPIE